MGRLLAFVTGLALLSMACTGPAELESPEPDLATGPSVDQAEEGLRVSTAGWATDFSRHDIPLDEIVSGGPGKGWHPHRRSHVRIGRVGRVAGAPGASHRVRHW